MRLIGSDPLEVALLTVILVRTTESYGTSDTMRYQNPIVESKLRSLSSRADLSIDGTQRERRSMKNAKLLGQCLLVSLSRCTNTSISTQTSINQCQGTLLASSGQC